MTVLATANILKSGKVLRGYQQVDLVKAWIVRRQIISYATGMGKTTVASAIMRGFSNEVANRRYLFVGTKNQMSQTVKELEEDTGLTVATCTGAFEDQYELIIKRDISDYQILFITFEFFDNIDAVWFLYMNSDLFYGIFVDEAHLMSNFRSSSRALALRGLLTMFEVKFALTATPATTDIKQSVNLFHLFFHDMLEDLDDLQSRLRLKKTTLDEEFKNYYVNRSKGDLILGYVTTPHFIKPLAHQVGVKGFESYLTLKGPGAENCYFVFKTILEKHLALGKKGLVYVDHRKVMRWLVERLKEDGFKFTHINGETSDKDKDLRKDSYNNDEVDFMLTSITASLNLEADFLILYENCSDLVQFFGRGHRTMDPKIIDIDFLLVDESSEITYFADVVLPRYIELQYTLSKDYGTIIDMARRVYDHQNM